MNASRTTRFLFTSCAGLLLQMSAGIFAARIAGPEAVGIVAWMGIWPMYILCAFGGVVVGAERDVPMARGLARRQRAESFLAASWTITRWTIAGVLVVFLSVGLGWPGLDEVARLKWCGAGGVVAATLLNTYALMGISTSRPIQQLHVKTLLEGLGWWLLLPLAFAGPGGLATRLLLVTGAIPLGFIWWSRLRTRRRWHLAHLKRLGRTGYPIMATRLAFLMLYSLDTTLVAVLMSDKQLGYYTLVGLVVSFIKLVPLAVSRVSAPRFAELFGHTHSRRQVAREALAVLPPIMAVMVPVLAIGYFLAPTLTRLILPDFYPGLEAARISLLAGVFIAPLSLYTVYNVIGRQLHLMGLLSAGLLVNVPVTFVLLRADFGLSAFAWGFVSGMAVSGLLLLGGVIRMACRDEDGTDPGWGGGMNLPMLSGSSPVDLLVTAAQVTAWLYGVGSGWAQRGAVEHRVGAGAVVISWARAIGISLVFAILVTLVLAWWGMASPASFAVAGILFGLAGWGLLWREQPPAVMRQALRRSAATAVVFGVVLMVVFGLPRRGEWVVGGWDPGLYVNQGLHLAREGRLVEPDPVTYRVLKTPAERELFQTLRHNRHEVFPGIIADDASQQVHFQFFPGLPSVIACLAWSGGADAAVRVNHVLGVVALIIWLGFLWRATGPPLAVCTVALLSLQPVFLWHLQKPISEMLQLVLIGWLGLLWSDRREGVGYVVAVGTALMVCVLNRFSFFPLACFLLLCGVMASGTSRRWSGALAAGGMVSILVATWLDVQLAPVTIEGWKHLWPAFAAIAFGATCCLIGYFFLRGAPRRWASDGGARMATWATWWLLLWGPMMLWGPAALKRLVPRVDAANLLHMAEYLGWPLLVAGWLGLALFWFRRTQWRGGAIAVLVFLLGVTSMLLLERFIEAIYPWSTRRYIHTLLPLWCLGAGCLCDRVASFLPWCNSPLRRTAVALACALALWVPMAPRSWAALRATDYDGTLDALRQVSAALPDDSVLWVDHMWLGTPLSLAFGHDVLVVPGLDAKERARPQVEQAVSVLQSKVRQGQPVYLLTTSSAGVDYLPAQLPLGPPVELGVRDYHKTIHHRSRHAFEQRAGKWDLVLYPLLPGIAGANEESATAY